MPSVAIALQGPMMSFALSSHEREKRSQLTPTKSAVVGLLACCLGRRRGEDLSDLTALRMSVRVDAAGGRMQDYHTSLDVPRANGERNDETFVSLKDYLTDAAFLVVMSGEAQLIGQVARALKNPVFVPYLGRRSCFPSRPLFAGEGESGEALLKEISDLTHKGGEKTVYTEGTAAGAVAVYDQPLAGRRFGRREVVMTTIDVQGAAGPEGTQGGEDAALSTYAQ